MKTRWLAGCVSLLILLVAVQGAATVVRALSLAELTAEADLIVQATVERQEVVWDDSKKLIYTLTEVEVVDPLKGPAKVRERLIIRQIGGEIGDEAILVAGNARLHPGEEVIVFLDRDEGGAVHYVVGMAQGKYAVDRRGAEATVTRDLHDLTLVGSKGQPLKHPTRRPPALTLADFKGQLRALRAQ